MLKLKRFAAILALVGLISLTGMALAVTLPTFSHLSIVIGEGTSPWPPIPPLAEGTSPWPPIPPLA